MPSQTIAEQFCARANSAEACAGALLEDILRKFQSFYVNDNKHTLSRDPDELLHADTALPLTAVFIDKSWLRIPPRQFEGATWGAA
jgi:hypothetical protein